MDFIFRDPSVLDRGSLTQGDVIEKTPEVVERIHQAHQYYADAPHYTHFVVLTQSCDLVKRRNEFKAPYITVAAARPLRKTMSEFLLANAKPIDGAEFTFHLNSLQNRAKQLLERHLNSTEPEYFFLPQSGHPAIPEDLVVFLRLTIALRKEHYNILAQAKIAELDDVFQAKIGWLKGNIYSRVATPDLEERGTNASEIKRQFFETYIPKDSTVWLSPLQAKLLKKRVKELSEARGHGLTTEEVIELLKNEIPEDTQIVAGNIVDRLKTRGIIDGGDDELARRILQAIVNEPTFKTVVNTRS